MTKVKTLLFAIILIFISILSANELFATYDPSTGRWLNRDPVGEEGGENLYSFVWNNPVSEVDPNGLTPWTSQRTTKSVVEILKGLDFLVETYEYRFETENSAQEYMKDLREATIKYQKLLGLNGDGCWGKGTEKAHLKKVGQYKKSVILTFDDGPGQSTLQILSILNKNNITGVFFVLGSRVKKHSSEAQQIANNHFIEVHGWSHPQFTTLSQNQIDGQLQKAIQIIQSTTGKTPTRFRPPYGDGWVGSKSQKVIKGANDAGLILTGWDVDTEDWKTPKGIKFDYTDQQFRNYIKAGHITKTDVLMHDTYTTAKDLPKLIERLKSFGYEFTTY